MRSTKSTEWKPEQGLDMEENVRRSVYRLYASTSRDNGRFVSTRPEVDRFWSKVRLAGGNGCWLWLGAPNASGYGTFARTPVRGVKRRVLAHRFAYELLVGQIPEKRTLDHLCETPLCVRPSHLEPVSIAVNLSRRHARRRAKNGASR